MKNPAPWKIRAEYYFEPSGLVRRQNTRARHKRWKLVGDAATLVATIESAPNDSFKVQPGVEETADRIATAVRMERGMDAPGDSPDIGPKLPSQVFERIRATADAASAKVTTQFGKLGAERPMTGALFSNIDDEFQVGGVNVKVSFQIFGENPKEKILGADGGIVIDISNGESRVIKAIWIQAKQAPDVPAMMSNLSDLGEQARRMRARTSESYGLVFTPDGVRVSRLDGNEERISVGDLIVDAAKCLRGDRSNRIIAQTIDRDWLLLVEVSPVDVAE